MQTTAGNGVCQCYLAHPRMYPIVSSARTASLGKEPLFTPSLSELSVLDGIGPSSVIVTV